MTSKEKYESYGLYGSCVWEPTPGEDNIMGVYKTECGKQFILGDNTYLFDMHINFCCGCGKKLKVPLRFDDY